LGISSHSLAMSAPKPESVAAGSKDARLRASASASVAATAASPAAAVASSSSFPFPSLAHELTAVKQQIAALQPKIDATEKRRGELRGKGDPDWKLDNEELKQLRAKEALLLKKEEQLRDELKRKERVLQYGTCSTGQGQPTLWPASLPFNAAVLSCMILASTCVHMPVCPVLSRGHSRCVIPLSRSVTVV
jgi:hypothetical protein